jgi:hypothetical protein
LRAHLAEFGMVAAQGLRNVGELIVSHETNATHPEWRPWIKEPRRRRFVSSLTNGTGSVRQFASKATRLRLPSGLLTPITKRPWRLSGPGSHGRRLLEPIRHHSNAASPKLGILDLNRKSSIMASSSPSIMICSRSVRPPLADVIDTSRSTAARILPLVNGKPPSGFSLLPGRSRRSTRFHFGSGPLSRLRSASTISS